ncbi:MAG: ABC transporter permease [Acidimicrobiales bacterium]|nr:ABC transporter permease [Acidimicrobiales bacterium]
MSTTEPVAGTADQAPVTAASQAERVVLGAATSTAAVVAALLAGGLILLVSGRNPLTAYGAIIDGALGSKFAIGETLARAAPLAIVGYGAAVALRAGLVTLGAQGQVIAGAIGALVVAQLLEGAPSVVALPVVALAGALAGAVWVIIPALLRAHLRVNEILSTLLFTEFAALLVQYLLNGPLKEDRAITPKSDAFPENARLGLVLDGTRFHAGVLVAVAVGAVFAFWIRSVPGFRYDLYGENPKLAQSLGVSGKGVIVKSLLVSGAAAGLVGWIQAAGLLDRVYVDIAADLGFFGLVVAFLGGASPGGILAASLLFGGLQAGGLAMQSGESIPATLSDMIQALILLGFSVRYAPQIRSLLQRVVGSMPIAPGRGGAAEPVVAGEGQGVS